MISLGPLAYSQFYNFKIVLKINLLQADLKSKNQIIKVTEGYLFLIGFDLQTINLFTFLQNFKKMLRDIFV